MDDRTRVVFGWGSKNSAERDLEASGYSSNTQNLLSAESNVNEFEQRGLKSIESHSMSVEKEQTEVQKEFKYEASTTEAKETVEYPVDTKIHANIKSVETEMHLGVEQPNLKLEATSEQSFTGGKREIHSVSNALPNLEVVIELKDMTVLASKNLKERDMDIEQIGSSSDEAHKTKTIRENYEGSDGKVRRETGVKPKVKSSLEEPSLFEAEDYEYEKYPVENLCAERNAFINLYEDPKPWVKTDYGSTDLRSKLKRTERRINCMTGHCLSGSKTTGLVELEESIELAHEASESARKGASACILFVETVEDGINVAQKYVEITSNRAKQEGSKNSSYQSDEADEYRRILFIASEKAKEAKRRAQNVYVAAKNTYKAATVFLKVLVTESGNAEDAHFLMNWTETLANRAKVDAFKATFASLKAIKKCFRKMDYFKNMVPSSNRNLDDLARIKKRTRRLNIVLILAVILGCVIVGLYNVFKPSNAIYIYSGIVLIICSVIVGFCVNLSRYNDESVNLEEKTQRTIQEIDEYISIMDEYFKIHNITPVHSESDDDV